MSVSSSSTVIFASRSGLELEGLDKGTWLSQVYMEAHLSIGYTILYVTLARVVEYY